MSNGDALVLKCSLLYSKMYSFFKYNLLMFFYFINYTISLLLNTIFPFLYVLLL
ncbi:hypothetical protein NBO_28g0003 [Nosema bombycis CQ1]|uniref:Uncharacterized protein n=1 Tax=Nosema bombycis (strain CQ1 / CVCC 102059) TaxID=578461 RepID=R0M8U1_NOSB1|nr:hypothetical protein NBO_28g0003 [Nosema bombycis CQ1]|eukprot:EOB14364.1 hypothetical protein NBO_28g0003 [Nosema bombycis CQ1]